MFSVPRTASSVFCSTLISIPIKYTEWMLKLSFHLHLFRSNADAIPPQVKAGGPLDKDLGVQIQWRRLFIACESVKSTWTPLCCAAATNFNGTTSTFVGEDKTTLCMYFGMPGQIARDFASLWSVCSIVPISIEARLVLVLKSLQIMPLKVEAR